MRPLFTLGPRLALCASLVRPGAALIDVGTDHAYLPIWLLLGGKVPRALGLDVNPGPLAAARRNGDRMRRCNTIDMPRDVRRVLGDINDVLDQLP